MSQWFASSARQLAGATGRLWGWPPDWFWNTTPAELGAILSTQAAGEGAAIDRQTINKLMEQDRNGR